MRALVEVLKDQPQSEKILGRNDMAKNNAGGHVFTVDQWTRLERFLILGTEGGSYYVGQRSLTLDNADSIIETIREDGGRVVDVVRQISLSGRAPKNDQALFVLALCASFGSDAVKSKALRALPDVARIGTHLFQFISFLKSMRGFGRSVKRALGDWYKVKNTSSAALQMTKYRSRHNWSHRDVLRVAHPKTDRTALNDLFSWATNPDDYSVNLHTTPYLEAFLRLQQCDNSRDAARLISEHGNLTHEMVPTELKDVHVWEALLNRGMPTTALIRNLPTLTRLGLLEPMSENEGARGGCSE